MRRYFPSADILAITNNERTANQLVLTRGVTSYVDGTASSLDEFYTLAEKAVRELGLAVSGDVIIATVENKYISMEQQTQ